MDDEIIENHCIENAILPVLLTSFVRNFLTQADALDQDGCISGKDIIHTDELAWSNPMEIDRASGESGSDVFKDVCIVSGDNEHSPPFEHWVL